MKYSFTKILKNLTRILQIYQNSRQKILISSISFGCSYKGQFNTSCNSNKMAQNFKTEGNESCLIFKIFIKL